MDTSCFVVKSCRAITYWMEKVCSCPVKYRHEVITNNFNAELRKIFNCFDVVCDVLITSWKTNLDVVMYVNGFYNVHVETVFIKLFLNFSDFFY